MLEPVPITPHWHPHRPLVMGILNATPDSFSDGGAYMTLEAAVEHAANMIRHGADIIDVGPESSRPGAEPVDVDEQIRRAVPIVQAIRGQFAGVPISIDTRLTPVAAAALDAGANIVNDISAGRDDPGMAALVAARDATVVLMHMQGRPATMQAAPHYDAVTDEVLAFLIERAAAFQTAGVPAEHVIIDPGIGFGKTVEHNLTLLRDLKRFTATEYPVLLGASRKRFLSKMHASQESGTETEHRLGGSLACAVRAMESKVRIVRVHDVRETCQLLDTLTAIRAGDNPVCGAPKGRQ